MRKTGRTLYEQAVAGRDGAQIVKLEELRRALPEEFGDASRDGHSAGRLEGHLLVGRAGLDVAEKRVEDFERIGYLRCWEVGGEWWSRFQIDRRLARAEARAEFQEGRAAAYTEKTKLKLHNLPHLLDRGENCRKAESAQAEAELTRVDVARLQAIREEVTKLIEAEREGLRVGVEREKVFAGVLSDVVAREREGRASVGLGAAAPVLAEGEMRRLEAHAALLRDPEMLRQRDDFRFQRLPVQLHGRRNP